MTDYSALVAMWATLTGTTDEKLAAINSLMVTTPPIKAIVTPSQIINCVDYKTFSSLKPSEQNTLALLLSGNTVDVSIGTTTRQALQAMFLSSKSTTANLSALFAPFDNPQAFWWQVPIAQGGGGLNKPVSSTDLVNAGLV